MNNNNNRDIELNKKLVSTPLGVKVELMDIYGRDELAGFLANMSASKISKEAGVAFVTVKRLQANGGSAGYKGSSLRKLSSYVNTLLMPLS